MPKDEKKGRRAYLNDFKKDASGKYSYTGKVYHFQENGKSRKRVYGETVLWCVVLAGATLVNGCIPAPGMTSCFYLLLPYMIQFLFAVSVCYVTGRMIAGGDPIREYQYEGSVLKLPFRTGGTMVFAGILLAAEVVYLLTVGTEGAFGTAVCFLILEALTMAASWMLRREIKSQKWA